MTLTLRQLGPDDLVLMDGLLAVFGQAFDIAADGQG